jgi:uncharacterized protein YdeI (YjbR/CyaY-like superfamily)
MATELKNGIATFYAKTRKHWRQWLQKNHATQLSVWLIMYRKGTGVPSVYYSEAVDEALCFGWIDSKANKRDEGSYYQFFSKRSPKSNWSGVNKQKVEKLTEQGLMAPAGLAMVQLAQQSGTWTALEKVEAMEIPPDMQAAFNNNKTAESNFLAFPPSAQRGILQWIDSARTDATRQKRIHETVSLAAQNVRANQYVRKG